MVKIVWKILLKVTLKKSLLSKSYNEKLETLEIITAGKPKPKLNLQQIIKTSKIYFYNIL